MSPCPDHTTSGADPVPDRSSPVPDRSSPGQIQSQTDPVPDRCVIFEGRSACLGRSGQGLEHTTFDLHNLVRPGMCLVKIYRGIEEDTQTDIAKQTVYTALQ